MGKKWRTYGNLRRTYGNLKKYEEILKKYIADMKMAATEHFSDIWENMADI
jgi:hypothetical protein